MNHLNVVTCVGTGNKDEMTQSLTLSHKYIISSEILKFNFPDKSELNAKWFTLWYIYVKVDLTLILTPKATHSCFK